MFAPRGVYSPTGLAEWQIRKESDAPSGSNVPALMHTKSHDGTFNLAVADGTAFGDLELSARVKAVAGEEDQGRGPI